MNSRSFLIASSFARLAARAGGGTRLVEGYFPAVGERRTSIQIEGERAVLVVTNAPDEGGGERAEIPRGHAEALLAATAGRIDCLRTSLAIGQRASLVRIVSPGLLDLVTVNFDSNEAARAFAPPAWLGPEISDEPGLSGRRHRPSGCPGTARDRSDERRPRQPARRARKPRLATRRRRCSRRQWCAPVRWRRQSRKLLRPMTRRSRRLRTT